MANGIIMSQHHLAAPRPSSRTATRSSAANAGLLAAAAADAPLGVVVDHPPKLACANHPEAVVDMDDSSSSSSMSSSSMSSSNEEDSSERSGRKRFQRLLLPEGAGQPDRAAVLDVSDGGAPAPVPSGQDRVRSVDLLRGGASW
jgi:hypothetical protein